MSSEQSDAQAKREAKARLKQAEKDHSHAMKGLERSLKDAQKAHDKAVADAEQHLSEVEQGRALAVCAPFTLFADRVHTSEGTVPLGPGMSASVESSGSLQVEHRPTVTRACCTGCLPAFFWRKKETHDTRNIFLQLQGPNLASVAQLPPNQEQHARTFAAAFNGAVSGAPAARAEREKAAVAAQADLERVRADRSGIEQAESDIADTQAQWAATHEQLRKAADEGA